MNTDLELISSAVDKLELEVLHDRLGVALVYYDHPSLAPVISDGTYWASENTRQHFERRAARRAQELSVTRWVFGTPLIITEDLRMRPPNPHLPPRDYEFEIIWLVAVDLASGVDVARVDIVRKHDGVTFGELMHLTEDGRFTDDAPGFRVIRAFHAG